MKPMDVETLIMTRDTTMTLIKDLMKRLEKTNKALDDLGYEKCDGCGKFVHGNDALLKGNMKSYVIMCAKCFHEGS